MNGADRFLLHTLDATTPGGIPGSRAHAIGALVVKACAYLAAFVLGFVLGANP